MVNMLNENRENPSEEEVTEATEEAADSAVVE
jgi:hypothetical protein